MALIESMFLPRLVDELARMSSQAGQDFRDGGEARMLQGIDDEHRTHIEKVLLELYEVAGQSGFSYINGLYGKKKGSMAEALARLAESWFPTAFAMSTSIAETSKEYLRAVTHKLVAEGVHENEMARSIREAGESVSLSRARTIARTESHAAVMESQQQVLDDMDLPPYKKVWMAGSDGRVRKAHAKADGQERLPNEPFDVGGDSLMYPAERGGKPENVINCRCVTTEKFLDDEAAPSAEPEATQKPRRESETLDLGYEPYKTRSGIKIGNNDEMSAKEKEFHDYGEWSAQSDEEAKLALRYASKVGAITQRGSGSSFRVARLMGETLSTGINMSKKGRSPAVWRHEYAHHLDHEAGKKHGLSYELSDENKVFDRDRDAMKHLDTVKFEENYGKVGEDFAKRMASGEASFADLDKIRVRGALDNKKIEEMIGGKISDLAEAASRKELERLQAIMMPNSVEAFHARFLKNMRADLETMKDGFLGRKHMGAQRFLRTLAKDKTREYEIDMFFDYVGAITFERSGAGHGIKYYLDDPTTRGAEAFAEFFALLTSDRSGVYDEAMRLAAPQSYRIMRKVLKEMDLGK